MIIGMESLRDKLWCKFSFRMMWTPQAVHGYPWCSSPRMSNVGETMVYSAQSMTCALEYTSSAAVGLQVPATDQPLSLAA